MKRILFVILWTATFCVLAVLAAGLLNGLVIATGFTSKIGDSWDVICVALTDVIVLLGLGLGLYFSLTGRLPGTAKAARDPVVHQN
jgi:putative copper export protein